MDLFLANREASREGGVGGETGREEGGVGGGGSVRFLCSSSFRVSFLEVMVMDWRVDR